MPYPFRRDPILRLNPFAPEAEPTDSVPDAPRPLGPRGEKSRRPHSDAKVRAVRRLIEQTTLTYGEIAARTGVGRASICRWTRDGAWQRPPFAPRATDTVPRARAGQRLKLRLLAERLRALAERHIRELEAAPRVEIDALMQALEVLKMARYEAVGRRGRRRLPLVQHWVSAAEREEIFRKALRELHRQGVEVAHAPKEAVDLFVDARVPPEVHGALGRRKKR